MPLLPLPWPTKPSQLPRIAWLATLSTRSWWVLLKDVAAKYAGQKDAVDKLAVKIIKGGSGVWGPVPMPANAQVNEAEAKKLAAWVMAQK